MVSAASPEALEVDKSNDAEAVAQDQCKLTSSVRVLYANVRGLRQAAGELSSLVLLQQPELIVLTETHLKGDSVQAGLIPEGYKVVVRFDRTKHGGGVMILALDHILLDAVKCDKWCKRKSAEIIGVETKDWALLGCYTQNSRTSPDLFAALSEIRDCDRFCNKKLMFFMDANAHHSTWLGSTSTDRAGKVAKQFAQDYGMEQYVDFPTRGVNVLDLIIGDVAVDAEPLPHLGTSDHISILATFESTTPMPAPPPKRKVYHWKTAPWDRIIGALRKQLGDWKASAFDSVNVAVDDLYGIIYAVVDKYVKKSMPGKARPAPWWSRLCSRALVAKYAAFKVRSSDPKRYKAACTELKFQERKAFAQHCERLTAHLKENRNDADWWHKVKLHAGAADVRTSAAPNAEELATFFAEKLSLDGEENDEVPPFDVSEPSDLSSFRITTARVRKVLAGLDPKKSMNGISPRLLKACSGVLALPVCRLFKRIIKSCEWPERWKLGRVSSIWKRNSKSDPKNYRPVTVLDNLSLVLERVIDPQLTRFLYKFIPENQFGFKRRCGTDDFSICLTTTLHQALEAESEAILVALDVAGAFDKVWWKALLKKMQVCGCKGRALRLFESYFSDRYLYVVAMGIASAKKGYTAGVPQGGIWSPKLWNFFIQDMADVCLLSELFQYADDGTVLSIFDPNKRQEAIADLNADLKRIARWGRRWKTTFEPSKTHAMFVTNTKDAGYHPAVDLVEFDRVKVGYDDVLKIVGVLYDHKLTWGPMVKEMAGRGRQALGYLRKLGRLITSDDIACVYKYFVRSKMEYGNASYVGAAKTHLAKLDAVQDRAIKLTGDSHHLQTLENRRHAACFGLLCKILDGNCVTPLLEMCPGFGLENVNNHSHHTRLQAKRIESEGSVRVTDMRNTLRKESLKTFERTFICRAHDIFNMIPHDLKMKGIEESWSLIMKDGQRFLSSM